MWHGVLVTVVMASVALVANERAGVTWSPPVEVARGAGERGPWRQNESRYNHVDDGTLAFSSDGGLFVGWVDHAQKDVFVRYYASDGRVGDSVNVSRTPAIFSWLPRLVVSRADARHVYVLWQEIVFSGGSHGGEMFFARSEDRGATFGPPVNLSRSLAGDGKGRITRDVWHNGSFDLAEGEDGTLHVAWTDYEGSLWYTQSGDQGRTFARRREIDTGHPGKPARGPTLVAAGRGVFLGWTTGEDSAADLRVAHGEGGVFSPPVIVARTAGYSDAPKLGVDARGTLHVVFAEMANGALGRGRVLYSRSRDRGRTFDAPRAISGRGGAEGAGFPHLAIGPGEELYIVFERFETGAARPHGLKFVTSVDAGRSFSEPVLLPGLAGEKDERNGSFQGLLMRKLAVNEVGEIGVINSVLDVGSHSRILLLRGRHVPTPQ